MQMLGVEG